MRRDAQTMDAKDWIILRLVRAMARNGLSNHLEYTKAAMWVYEQLDLFESRHGSYDPLLQLDAEDEPEPQLLKGFPTFSQRQFDNWKAEEARHRASDSLIERFAGRCALAIAERELPPPECLAITLMEND